MVGRLLTFVNTHRVIKAERLLRGSNLEVEVIPTPKDISSECGMSLVVKEGEFQRALDILAEAGVEVVSVHEWKRE